MVSERNTWHKTDTGHQLHRVRIIFGRFDTKATPYNQEPTWIHTSRMRSEWLFLDHWLGNAARHDLESRKRTHSFWCFWNTLPEQSYPPTQKDLQGFMFWTWLNQAKGNSTELSFSCFWFKHVFYAHLGSSVFSLPGKHSKGRRPADDGASERWYCCGYAWSRSCSASCSGAQLERASEWRRSATRCDKMWQDVTRVAKEHTRLHKPHQSESLKCGFWFIEVYRKVEIHLISTMGPGRHNEST